MSDQGEREERGWDEAQAPLAFPYRGEHPMMAPAGRGGPGDRDDLGFDDDFGDLGDLDDLVALTDHDDIDFSRVHADDAFLDALGAAMRAEDRRGLDEGLADDELAALLTSWRDEVDSEPIGELVDPKLAVNTVFSARVRHGRRRPRLLVPFAAAAAVLAIALTGAGLVARDAQPGDTLWGLTKVLYADHARSVEAAASVRADLNIAESALAEGDVAEARSKLMAVEEGLPAVSSEDGREDLAAQHADLLALLPDNPAVGVVLPPSGIPTTAAPTTRSLESTTAPTTPGPTTVPTTAQTTSALPSTQPTTTTTAPTSTTVSESPRSDPATQKLPDNTGTGTGTGTGTEDSRVESSQP